MSYLNPIQRTIFTIFFIQFAYALLICPLTGETDFFPLHKWALFGQIQKNYEWPVLYIQQWGEEKYEVPQNYYDFFQKRKGIDFLPGQDLVFEWYIADGKNNVNLALHKREAFEKHFFKDVNGVVYKIHIVKLNQIEYLRNRKIRDVIKTYGPYMYESGNSDFQ